jgi:Flp pilus assembly pilin Flp
MLLNIFVRAQVGWAEFRTVLRTRLVDMAGSEHGGVAAEYALLIALIAVVIVVGAAALGLAINARLNDTATCVGGAPAC